MFCWNIIRLQLFVCDVKYLCWKNEEMTSDHMTLKPDANSFFHLLTGQKLDWPAKEFPSLTYNSK